jgi:DNA-binding CsgD family transcriptional regulator
MNVQALNLQTWPELVLRPDLSIMDHAPAIHHWLATWPDVRIEQDRLKLRNPATEAAVRAALVALMASSATGPAHKTLRLSEGDGGPALFGVFSSLTTYPTKGTSADTQPRRVIFICTLRSTLGRGALGADDLKRLFCLTDTEASVAISLYHGMSVEEISAYHDIRQSTVRWHLDNVRGKTDARDMLALLRLLNLLTP